MRRNIKQFVTGTKALKPQAASAGNVVGVVIDRDNAREAIVTLITGAATGAPTTTTVKAVVKHGDKADGTDQANVTGLNGTFETVTIGADGQAYLAVDLEGLKRYVTVTAVVAFTGGTTPTVNVAATAALGNYEINPDHVAPDGTLTYGRYAGDGKGY